jgi:Protein of unknown function (DUF2752)
MKSTSSRARTGSEYVPVALAAAGTAAGLAVSYLPAIQDRLLSPHSGCLFRRVTGLKCPFCGMTHAVIAMDHGHVLLAARLNAIVFLLVIACLAAAANRFEQGRTLLARIRLRIPRLTTKGGLYLALAYSVLRDV